MIRWRRRRAGAKLVGPGYFALPVTAPIEARVRLSDQALTMLRPRLGSAWLDTAEPADGWPPQERRHSAAEMPRPGAGAGPDTVGLNPAEADSRGRPLIVWILALFVIGPNYLTDAAQHLLRQSSLHGVLRQLVNPIFLLEGAAGIACVAYGLAAAHHAALRILARRRLTRSQELDPTPSQRLSQPPPSQAGAATDVPQP